MIEVVLAIALFIALVYLLIYLFSNKTLVSYSDATVETVVQPSSLADPTSTNYTYSVWVYIKDWSVNYGRLKPIVVRDGNVPSIYLGAVDNTLTTKIKLSDGRFAVCEIAEVPIQAWTNILITVSGKSLDTYLNGKLVKTCVLTSPQATPSDSALLHLTPNGGFSGYTARLKYWAAAIGPQEAWNNYVSGPGGNFFNNVLSQYKLQFNFLKGTETQLSVTI